jgi:hypothetical protein
MPLGLLSSDTMMLAHYERIVHTLRLIAAATRMIGRWSTSA